MSLAKDFLSDPRIRPDQKKSGLRALLLLAVLALGICGCRTADVKPGKPEFDTDVKILEPAYAMRRASEAPWYAGMQVLLDEKPVDEKDLTSKISDGKPEVRKNTEELLQEIENKIDEQRKNEKWSIIAVQCGRGKKPNEIHFEAEVGITKLYTRRPSIVINGVPMDICVAKLCRESEVQDAQPKGHNPLVSYEKKNVSAYEAIDTILKTNGFDLKYSDTSYKVSFKAQDYASRKEFVDAVTQAILTKGRALNSVKPALVVSQHVKETPKPDESRTPGDPKTPADPKAKAPENAPAPPPPAP
jgi:hypothetical protein